MQSNTALKRISPLLDGAYAEGGRESIAPERLLRAQLLQVLYSIRSERQLVEQTHYNLLFRWFVGLSIDAAVGNHSTFSKNRDRRLEHEAIPALFAEVVRLAAPRGRLSTDHFSVDGTLIQAWASHKSFRPKEDGPGDGTGSIGRNVAHDFHDQKRTNDTHASTTDPDARLYRKSANTGAVLCYQGPTVVENRHGLVVRRPGQSRDRHGRTRYRTETAGVLAWRTPQDGRRGQGLRRVALVEGCRALRITPHVAAKNKGSAMDQRTQRHAGYAVSQRKRKRVEEPFGGGKLIGQIRQVKQRGKAQVNTWFQTTMMGWNLVRMRNLLAASPT